MEIGKLVFVSKCIFDAPFMYSFCNLDIADVTYFVKHGMPMDVEAAFRGTSVYLVDKRLDMLPSLLGTSKYCFLEWNHWLSYSKWSFFLVHRFVFIEIQCRTFSFLLYLGNE